MRNRRKITSDLLLVRLANQFSLYRSFHRMHNKNHMKSISTIRVYLRWTLFGLETGGFSSTAEWINLLVDVASSPKLIIRAIFHEKQYILFK